MIVPVPSPLTMPVPLHTYETGESVVNAVTCAVLVVQVIEFDTEVDILGVLVLETILTVVKLEHPLFKLVTVKVYVPEDVKVAVEELAPDAMPEVGDHENETLLKVPVLAEMVGEVLEQVMVALPEDNVITGALASG